MTVVSRAMSSAVLVTLLIGIGGCGSDDPDPAEARCEGVAKIGLIGNFTGPASALNASANNGALLAVEHFRRDNPQCQVETISKDSQGVRADIPRLAQELADDPTIIGVVGPGSSADTAVANPIFAAASLTTVSPTAVATDLTQQGHATFHRMLGNNVGQAAAITRYIDIILRPAKVFIVYDGKAAFALDNVTELRKSPTVDGEAAYATGQKDFSAIIGQIAASGADAVFLSGYYTEAGLLLKQLRASGSTATFLTNAAVAATDFLAGPEAEGAYVFLPTTPVDAIGGSYVADFRATFNTDPDPYTSLGYDAATVLLAGVKAGANTREKMEAFVDDYDAEGYSGRIRFAPNGDLDADVVSAWAFKVTNGEMVLDQRMYSAPQPGD